MNIPEFRPPFLSGGRVVCEICKRPRSNRVLASQAEQQVENQVRQQSSSARSGATKAKARSLTFSRSASRLWRAIPAATTPDTPSPSRARSSSCSSFPAACCARAAAASSATAWCSIPFAFMKEVDALRAHGVNVDGNLFVSNRAHVILPYHRMIELASENAPGRVKIGTTSRGIGPTYEDKMARSGLARAGPARQDAAAEAHRERLPREEHHRARAVQQRAARSRQDVRRLCGDRRSRRAVRHRHRAAAEPGHRQRRVGNVRRRAGHDARHRSRNLSVRHVVERDLGRRCRPEPACRRRRSPW